VTTIKHKCEEDARRIALEKSTCEADLAKAQPFVDQADAAISSIKPAHIQVCTLAADVHLCCAQYSTDVVTDSCDAYYSDVTTVEGSDTHALPLLTLTLKAVARSFLNATSPMLW
jgi:hypothetical protein